MTKKVILRDDVPGLGKSGDVRQVKDGFAHNFLLPRNLALLATDQNLKQIESEKKKKENRQLLEKKKAQDLSEKLSTLSLTMAVEVNEAEELYGSLTVNDIVKALSAEGVDLDKKCIVLEQPIKNLGIYDLEIRLCFDVSAKLKVWVVKK
ncbi:MAG: 50S ribosomal protein L9 [Candidatus Omnitrophota bacterium]